jgi:hypothetical protein
MEIPSRLIKIQTVGIFIAVLAQSYRHPFCGVTCRISSVVKCHRLQRVLDSGSQAHPLMTVPQQSAQISLLGGGHPDRWETILCQQLQKQARIPPSTYLSLRNGSRRGFPKYSTHRRMDRCVDLG